MAGSPGDKPPDALAKTAVTAQPVRTERGRGVLTVTGGDDVGRVISIGTQLVSFGRSDECTVRFQDASLSRVHARIVRVGDEYVLKDMGSTNGSFVNDEQVDFAVQLRDGDRVRLGSATSLRFSLVDATEEHALKQMYEASKRESVLAAFQSVEERDETLKDDLLQAREFQRRALPEAPRVPGVHVDVVYRPLELVGGDLYHVSTVGDRLLRVFIADATGHGVKASLTTMLILSEYEIVKRQPAGPAGVLHALNERMATTYAHLGVRFTAACLDLDFTQGKLSHASAAHPAPVLLRGAAVTELDAGGTFMGLVPGATFPEWELALRPADAVLTFTDGVREAWDAEGEPLSDERFARAVRDAEARGGPLAGALSDELTAFVGAGRSLADDVTLIAIRWTGESDTTSGRGSVSARSKAR